ncbi:type-F conjugative transfer system mating-pair stabilization protein TraN [Vibrio mimicus]
MRLYPWLAVTLSLLSVSAFTDEQQTFTDSADWAKQTADQALKPDALPLNIDDYCKDATCRRDIRNPKQSGLSDGDIDAQKDKALVTNEVAQDIQANFNKGRPDIKNDPAMQFALLGQENAFEVTHGVSNAYVDCASGKQCITEFIAKTCNAPTNANVPCYKTPTASVITDSVIYTCPAGWTENGTDCSQTVTECRFDSNNQVVVESGSGWCANNGTRYTWDGHLVDPSQGFTMGELIDRQSSSCKGSALSEYYQICGPALQTIPATRSCNSGYTLSGGNCIKNEFTWKTECHLISDCHVIDEQCLEGQETRTINGIPTTLDCWKYQVNHQCDLADSCASLPSDCKTTSHTCSLKQNGVCVENEIKKSCPEKSCRTTSLECGEQSFCLDGDCYVEQPKLNSHFDKSVAALAGLADAVKEVGDPPKIFTGKPMKCDKKPIGFNDCCKDSGWGQHVGAKCSEAEEALGKAKEKGLTLYVGQYCAKKVLGVCTSKKRSYCVYDSMLAKIIQEQGALQQLGKGLGSAETPTCAAITPEELGQINFKHIDFAEFYPEMRANTNLPNFDEIKKRLESAAGG